MRSLRKKNVRTPVIAVTGGKGGTGKTTVAVNLALGLNAKGLRVMLVDADVDGPSCAPLLGVKLEKSEEVRTFKPAVDEEKCTGCMKCVEVCSDHALVGLQGKAPRFFEELCSGCRACQLVCESGAIKDSWKVVGTIRVGSANGLELVVGELKPTEPRSPIMARATVLKAMDELQKDERDVVIVDTAPGVHNAVAQPLWVADLALAVTEPTPLGTHDLKFILDLARRLELPAKIVLNKANIPGGLRDEILTISREWDVEVAAEIPMDDKLLESYLLGEPVVKRSPESPSAKALLALAEAIYEKVKGGEI